MFENMIVDLIEKNYSKNSNHFLNLLKSNQDKDFVIEIIQQANFRIKNGDLIIGRDKEEKKVNF